MSPSHRGQLSLQQACVNTVCQRVAALLWVAIALTATCTWAQQLSSPTNSPSTGPASIPLVVASKPDQKPLWKDLTPAQQQALKPLAAHWNNTSEFQKRKWLAMSLNFAKMTPTEQANLYERMEDWSALSPTQRTQARLNYSETKRLAPTEKQAKWKAYQTLDPEEKEKLAKKVRNKLPGAATAPKLVAPQKLATVPPGRKDEPKGPSIAAAPHQINPKTLLPLPPQQVYTSEAVGANAAKPAVQ